MMMWTLIKEIINNSLKISYNHQKTNKIYNPRVTLKKSMSHCISHRYSKIKFVPRILQIWVTVSSWLFMILIDKKLYFIVKTSLGNVEYLTERRNSK